jgi:gamma-glutamylcyclotransferase (GGCT)/AIG2-like uncharacterized protein YtfP
LSGPGRRSRLEVLSAQQPNQVFVYGTLKRGEHNHEWLTEFGAIRAPGFYETAIEYPLVVANLPYLLPLVLDGKKVKGEVYEVSSQGLAALDALEGHPHFYTRFPIVVKRLGREKAVTAYTYFLIDHSANSSFKSGKLKPISWYTDTNQPEPV